MRNLIRLWGQFEQLFHQVTTDVSFKNPYWIPSSVNVESLHFSNPRNGFECLQTTAITRQILGDSDEFVLRGKVQNFFPLEHVLHS